MPHFFTGVETSVGYITAGRDAVHVDSIEQKSSTLTFKGDINSRFCRPEYQKLRWHPFQLTFEDVKVYRCENIEVYPWQEWNCEYAFSEVMNSEWHAEYGMEKDIYRHFIFETYDYIYFVLCKNFEMVMTEQRDYEKIDG